MFSKEINESDFPEGKVEIIAKNPLTWGFIKTNGIKLNVLQCGETNKEKIVFLHGFPETGFLSWHKQVGPICDAGYHVIVPDMRGYNTSDKPLEVSDYKKSILSDDIKGLIDSVGAKTINLVGHDWGGLVAWDFAISYPDSVKKLIILNAPHAKAFDELVMKQFDFEQLLKSYYILYFQVPFLSERAIYKNEYRGLKSIFINDGRPSFTRDYIHQVVEAFNRTNSLTSTLNYYRALKYDLLNPKPESELIVKAPTLIIWGKLDVALSYKLAELSVKYCTNARVIDVANAGHFVQHDAPNDVTNHILEFIK